MSAYALTSLAKADIFEIWVYIAESSQDAADRVEQATNYTIVYQPDKSPLQIVAILHGKRNIRRILKQRR